jgi:hypothetical protein
LWSWPSGHHAPSYVHLHSVSSISCKDVLDRSFKANASLISPWVPLVRSPYADGFYSRYITDSRYSFRRKPFQNAFSQHEGLSTTSGSCAVVVVEVLTCVCWSSSLVVQVRALFWCRHLLWSWPSGHHAPSYVHLHTCCAKPLVLAERILKGFSSE